MGWYFDNRDAETIDDCLMLIKEIKAYKKLEKQSFDFGSGLIEIGSPQDSNLECYDEDIKKLKERILELKGERKGFVTSNAKERGIVYRRHQKQREKERLKRLNEFTWMSVVNRGEWLQRCYRGSRSAFLKKVSNKKIRRYKKGFPPKGNNCHKVFEFWWSLY